MHFSFMVIAIVIYCLALLEYASTNVWKEDSRIQIPSGRGSQKSGTAVAVYNQTILIGSWNEKVGGLTEAGAAYIFYNEKGYWKMGTRLTSPLPKEHDKFGASVSIQSKFIAIGAPGADLERAHDAGIVYLYSGTGRSLKYQRILTASNYAAGDEFGSSLALYKQFLLVGACLANPSSTIDAGAAYLFILKQKSWIEVRILTAEISSVGDNFGASVSLSERVALIGAPYFDSTHADVGAVHTFFFADEHVQSQRLSPENLNPLAYYGKSVSAAERFLLVGAPGAGINGAAFIYSKNGIEWVQASKLTSGQDHSLLNFGVCVDISNQLAIVGAWNNYGMSLKAEVPIYIFSIVNEVWTQQSIEINFDQPSLPIFGSSLSFHDGRIVIGTSATSSTHASSGDAAYILKAKSKSSEETSEYTRQDSFTLVPFIELFFALVGFLLFRNYLKR
eukprot:TRINITY_DN680_c0_g1_i1.p1 TRINITY_DN680_c0_g1~~TRINITY_DN680_c0_g1_i1.p1  ORF type:complete len:448 (-),score=48.23 TRINITY_DN680_c0_g1_i1:517-1860(-)